RLRVERLDAEAHGAEARRVQLVEQLDVESIEPRLGFEPDREIPGLDFVAQLQAPFALFAEQRIPEDDVGPPDGVAQPLDLVDDVGDRSSAIPREDPGRAVRAELGTASTREQRIPAADRPG